MFNPPYTYGHKADIYSFGIVSWELLIGEKAFKGVPIFAIPEMVLKGTRPLFPKGYDPRLQSLIEACWSADPKRRPEAQEIVSALTYLLTGPPPTDPTKSKITFAEIPWKISDNIQCAINTPVKFTIETYDYNHKKQTCGGEVISVILSMEEKEVLTCAVKDNNDGTYMSHFEALAPGKYSLSVQIFGLNVLGTPTTIYAYGKFALLLKANYYPRTIPRRKCCDYFVIF